MYKQLRHFSRAMKIIRNKPVKMLEIKSTAQRISYMDFSVDLTKESVNMKLKVNRNCPNWNKKRKKSGASKHSIQNLLENIKQSNKSITNLRKERKRTGRHKYFNKTMVENFSKITKTSNLDPISSENSKQDKYQEKKKWSRLWGKLVVLQRATQVDRKHLHGNLRGARFPHFPNAVELHRLLQQLTQPPELKTILGDLGIREKWTEHYVCIIQMELGFIIESYQNNWNEG